MMTPCLRPMLFPENRRQYMIQNSVLVWTLMATPTMPRLLLQRLWSIKHFLFSNLLHARNGLWSAVATYSYRLFLYRKRGTQFIVPVQKSNRSHRYLHLKIFDEETLSHKIQITLKVIRNSQYRNQCRDCVGNSLWLLKLVEVEGG